MLAMAASPDRRLGCGKGFVANVAVLLGIIAGAILAALLGKMSFAKVAAAPWFGLIYPLQFGLPVFEAVSAITMCLVMIESTGMFLALGEMTGKPVDQAMLTRGLRAPTGWAR